MSHHSIDVETRYRLIKMIAMNPDISQRELASELGVSLGKINYCIKALVDVGLVKASAFNRKNNRARCSYFLTPAGIREKIAITIRFLELKQHQFDTLVEEIERLKREVQEINRSGGQA